MMKRTNMMMGKRGAAFVVAGMMTVLGFSATAKADLPDPNVFLDYSTLDFVFTRTAATNDIGSAVGSFSISDVAGSTLDAILRDGLSNEIDRATITSDADFNVAVTGSVVYNGTNSYSLIGTFMGTDDTGATRVLADFSSIFVDVSPISVSKLFTIAGALTSPGGGTGSLLAGGTASSWTFSGHAGDTAAGVDVGGDDAISIVDANIASYDSGSLVDFTLGVSFSSLDELFSTTTTVGGGDMKVTIVPTPTALVLGMIGFGTVGWFRRRMS